MSSSLPTGTVRCLSPNRSCWLSRFPGLIVRVLIVVALPSILGCAGIKVQQVAIDKSTLTEKVGFANWWSAHLPWNRPAQGLRFNRPAPFLWVTTDEKGACVPQVVWMPDPLQEYVITTSAGIGSVEFSPTLENGWNLNGFESDIESKTAENLTALSGLIGSVGNLPLRAAVQNPRTHNVKELPQRTSEQYLSMANKEDIGYGPGLYKLNLALTQESPSPLIPVFVMRSKRSGDVVLCASLATAPSEGPQTSPKAENKGAQRGQASHAYSEGNSSAGGTRGTGGGG